MTGTALDHVLLFLIPLFLRGVGGDEDLARQAARHMLEAHGPVTDRDYLLAAELIACSFAALDNLGKSMADPDMAVSTCLRLRANANTLSRRAERHRETLDRAAKQSPQVAKSAVAPQTTPSAIQKIRDAIVEAAPNLAETLTNASQTMSRQQRRLLTRKVEQAREAREREARKAARFASRALAMEKDQGPVDMASTESAVITLAAVA